ncbi:LSM domain-containing protein [Cercophora scortea]|uniref:LSM domain-containing protein n=1 Tax=Cercophora scortea TaxID=314031 RepID=A0AAE0J3D5_9PEZI|nr:LSM domain-containing protein [Cercophora scortea]
MEDTRTSLKEARDVAREEAAEYLSSLLNKNLRVTTTDSRMFWGAFKCTDPESNLVLQHTYEYRHPSMQKQAEGSAAAAAASAGATLTSTPGSAVANQTFKMDMTSRYLGLVVVPGEHIVKIELEEFVSQMKKGPQYRSPTEL